MSKNESKIAGPNATAQTIAARAAVGLGTDNMNALGIPGDYVRLAATLWSGYRGEVYAPTEVAMMMALVDVAKATTGQPGEIAHYENAIKHIALAGQKAASEVSSFGEGGNLPPEVGTDVEAGIAGMVDQLQVEAVKAAVKARAIRHHEKAADDERSEGP